MGCRYKNKAWLVAVAALIAAATPAGAASLTNKDSNNHVVIVTENGVRSELSIAAGQTLTFCPAGCFVTMPSGQKAALSGSESVQIVDESPVLE